ncbi:MAG: single-stranded DNA-binding protein [Deltaproteobacteria bacterium]|nr:single-stranded DNA-binding protein [Deltaproteobacteria bacterium]
MAGSMNKVILVGRIGQDLELKYTTGGQPVTNMSVATDEGYTDSKTGNKVERTEWHRVVIFGRQAETCANYLGKGRLVLVEGKLQTRSWDDQQGQKRYMTEIVAQRVQFLDSKAGEQAGGYTQAPSRPKPAVQSSGRNDYPDDMGPAFPSEASAMDEPPF